MNAIEELYQELIIDHSRSPKNFGELKKRSHSSRGHNPLCGDIIDLHLLIENGIIADIAFIGDGCAISRASASLMTESIKGKRMDDAIILFRMFHDMLIRDGDMKVDLGKLVVLQGVKGFPTRVKCATLCWHALEAALAGRAANTTTE